MVRRVLGWLITAAALIYIGCSIDWRAAWQALGRVTAWDLLILVAIYLSGFLLRGLRSQIMLPQPGYFGSTAGVFIGYAANNVLPARLGEFVRAQVVGRLCGVRPSMALATIGVERVFDGLALVVLLFIGAQGLNLPAWVDSVRAGGVALFGGAMIVCIAIGYFAEKIKPRVPDNKIGHIVRGLIDGLAISTRSISVTVSLLVLSLAVWVIEGSMFVFGLKVFDLHVTPLAAFMVLGIVNLGLLVPSSPGFIGVFHGFVILSLGLLSVSKDEATAYAVVIHLCQYLPVTVIGLVLLHRLGFRSFKELSE